MNRFWIEELRNKCNEITEKGNDPVEVSDVANAYERIIQFADIAQKEGLFELEEESTKLNLNDESQKLFFILLRLIVDGTEPELVRIIGANKCISINAHAYEGLMNLMYAQGSLMIQAGDNLWVIKEMLKSMMPQIILDEIVRREHENEILMEAQKGDRDKEKIDNLCKDDAKIDEKDHSIVGEISKALLMLSDTDVQRVLRNISNGTLAVAMKGMPGRARARIFQNVSSRIAVMIADDMSYMGPVRFADVEDGCVRIIKELLELWSNSEIGDYDLSMLQELVTNY